jgi:Lecithin retinol acyltransferase
VIPGEVLGVEVHVDGLGVVQHKGLVSDGFGGDGFPRVLHSSKFMGRVAETTMTTFVHRAVEGARLRVIGYPGRLPWRVVLERARSRIGVPYDLVLANCEHYVAWCHGLEPTSPQLRAALERLGF